MLNFFLYASRDKGDRIKLLFEPDEIEIIYIKQKITRPRDVRLLRNLRDIDLAIVDPTLLSTTTEQDADHLVIAKDEAITRLLSAPPDSLSPSLSSASRIEGTGALLQVIDRIMSNA